MGRCSGLTRFLKDCSAPTAAARVAASSRSAYSASTWSVPLSMRSTRWPSRVCPLRGVRDASEH